MHKEKKERDAKRHEELMARREVQKEMNEIRMRYSQFKHVSVGDEAMRAFARFMKDKMTSR